jgi:hypothetical protein
MGRRETGPILPMCMNMDHFTATAIVEDNKGAEVTDKIDCQLLYKGNIHIIVSCDNKIFEILIKDNKTAKNIFNLKLDITGFVPKATILNDDIQNTTDDIKPYLCTTIKLVLNNIDKSFSLAIVYYLMYKYKQSFYKDCVPDKTFEVINNICGKTTSVSAQI